MKALTIWQPWATLIAEGQKPYEFRRWVFPRQLIGQRIAIHASARTVIRSEIEGLYHQVRHGMPGTGLRQGALPILEKVLECPIAAPLSSIVCTAILGEPRKAFALFGAVLGDIDRIDHHVWAWPLTSIERMQPPLPARGAQRFWNWSNPA